MNDPDYSVGYSRQQRMALAVRKGLFDLSLGEGGSVHARGFDDDEEAAKVKAERALQEKISARMDWLDAQDAEFRALVHGVGLNRACKQDGRRPPV